MVRLKFTRICGAIDENCFKRVEKEFETTEISCDCREACKTLKYDVITRAMPSSTPTTGKRRNNTYFRIQFNTPKVSALKKKVQFTTTDILSYVGGTLGKSQCQV
jgi:hypothetical protein